VNERARIRRLSPNGSDRERRAGVQAVGQGFSGLDFLVLFDQAKRTLIDVTAGRGFKALDSAFGRQAFGSLPSREKNVFEI
jgi:hypothetical protein